MFKIKFDIVSASFCMISKKKKKKNDGSIQSWLKVIGATSSVAHIHKFFTVNFKEWGYLLLLHGCSKPVWHSLICRT